jgi:hypothetical protein
MVFGLRTGFELGAGAFRKQVLRCSEAVTGLEFETLPAAEAFVSDWTASLIDAGRATPRRAIWERATAGSPLSPFLARSRSAPSQAERPIDLRTLHFAQSDSFLRFCRVTLFPAAINSAALDTRG